MSSRSGTRPISSLHHRGHLTTAKALPDTSRVRDSLAQHQELLTAPCYHVAHPVGLCSDLHLPLMDANLFEDFLASLQGHRCKSAAIVGDLFDQESFSSHPAGLTSPGNVLRNELSVAREVLLALLQVVDTLFILPGNHDSRIFKTLKYQLGMWDLIRIVLPEAGLIGQSTGTFYLDRKKKQIVVSRIPRIELMLEGERWVLLHPQAYSKVRGRIATQFADTEEAHVAIGHVHHHCEGFSSNGRWYALELGGLFDPRLIGYVKEHPRPGTNMTPGYFILGPGGPVGYSGLRRELLVPQSLEDDAA